MKLHDFVKLVIDSMEADKPLIAEQLDLDPEVDTDIYMKGGIDVDAELHFFDPEEIDYDLIFVKDGQEYTEFLVLWSAIEKIEALFKTGRYTADGIVQRLLEYRIKNA